MTELYTEGSPIQRIKEAAEAKVAKVVTLNTGVNVSPLSVQVNFKPHGDNPQVTATFFVPGDPNEVEQRAGEIRDIIIEKAPGIKAAETLGGIPQPHHVVEIEPAGDSNKVVLHFAGKPHDLANADILLPETHHRINPAQGRGGPAQ